MSSDFEKALARAAAERGARDEAKTLQELELSENVKLAYSIIDPCLAELGPQVVRTLRELKVPTKREYRRSGPDGGEDLGYWEFQCAYDSDSGGKHVRLNTCGRFDSGTGSIVGLLQGSRTEFLSDGNSEFSRLFANLDDQ